ncbi:twin-arginine translocase subunit TatC [Gandjariella thermophila]|nr:twin-arginine translocase subunit TatC [Gandjariella thermophila]
MTLIEHIYELRHRLAMALVALGVGALLGFLWFGRGVGPIPSLGDIVTGPYCRLPASVRLDTGHGCRLLQTQPFEAFLTQLKVGAAVGAVFTSPAWLYQIWAFITPGLYARERKYALSFVSCAVVLFAAGAVLAFFVVPEGLRVLVSFGGNQFITALAADKYISFVLAMLIIFGVSFELPLLVVMLNLAGVLSYDKLRRWRRGLIFGLFVFAAIATPGQDPISMLALAGALTLLFEIAVQITRLHDRRVARRRVEEGWDGISDDEASPLDLRPEPVAPGSPDEPSQVRYDDAT